MNFNVKDKVRRRRANDGVTGVVIETYRVGKGPEMALVEWESGRSSRTRISFEFLELVPPEPMIHIPSAATVKEGRVRGRQID